MLDAIAGAYIDGVLIVSAGLALYVAACFTADALRAMRRGAP